MDVTTRTQEEARRVIEVDGVEFYVEDLVQPLGWLRTGSIEDELVDTNVMERMEEAGLVRRQSKTKRGSFEHDHYEWEGVDGKCRELYEQLNEPYFRLRPEVDPPKGPSPFGMFDEQEDENARERAERVVAWLNDRNPDVEFALDEEQLSSIRVRE